MESEAGHRKADEIGKLKVGQLEKTVKNLKDEKKNVESRLMENKTGLRDRSDAFEEAKEKHRKLEERLENEKLLLENGKKQAKEYQEQYEMQKARLEKMGPA